MSPPPYLARITGLTTGNLASHLAGLEAKQGREEFERAIRITILAIAGFAGAVALGLLAVGPFALDLLFEDDKSFGRLGLAAVALGMGAHLAAGTLNQAALARDEAGGERVALKVPSTEQAQDARHAAALQLEDQVASAHRGPTFDAGPLGQLVELRPRHVEPPRRRFVRRSQRRSW